MIFSVAQSINCIEDNTWASLKTNVIYIIPRNLSK